MKENKMNIFLLATSIISTMILLIGATFSYFSTSNMSKLNALALEAGKVRLGLGVSELYSGHLLIPLKDELINIAYEQKCRDDLDRGACLAYTLEVFNYSKEHEIEGKIDFTIEGIENLSYMVLDENGKVYLDTTHIDSSASTGLSLGNPFKLEDATEVSSTSRKFTLLIWLTDTGDIQDETDASGKFNAAVTYTSSEGGKLTASVAGMESSLKETSVIN